MLACFSWLLHDLQTSSDLSEQTIEKAIAHFEAYFSRPPLEILADELTRAKAPEATCHSIFSTYDRFLAILDDETSRNELQTIAREHADKSTVFQEVRAISHEFRDALLNWLYTPDTRLYELVKQYGLF
jgi:hypothetical protein